MLVQSFVPPSETRFRADIVRLFKRENFVNSTINTASGAGPGPIGAGPIGPGPIGPGPGAGPIGPGAGPGAGTGTGTGPIGTGPMGAAGATRGVRGAVSALYPPGPISSYASYVASAMGAGRVSSGVNWVNAEPSAQPAYRSTSGASGGTSSGSSATGTLSASVKSSAKPNAHVLNALDEVIAQDSDEEDQPVAETVLGAPKEQNANNSHCAEDNASSHSDSDSNADEEEEQDEEDSNGDEKAGEIVNAPGTHLLQRSICFVSKYVIAC